MMICEDDVPPSRCYIGLFGSLTTLRTIRSRSMYKPMDADPGSFQHTQKLLLFARLQEDVLPFTGPQICQECGSKFEGLKLSGITSEKQLGALLRC